MFCVLFAPLLISGTLGKVSGFREFQFRNQTVKLIGISDIFNLNCTGETVASNGFQIQVYNLVI